MEKLQDNPIKEVIALAEKNFDMQELLKLRGNYLWLVHEFMNDQDKNGGKLRDAREAMMTVYFGVLKRKLKYSDFVIRKILEQVLSKDNIKDIYVFDNNVVVEFENNDTILIPETGYIEINSPKFSSDNNSEFLRNMLMSINNSVGSLFSGRTRLVELLKIRDGKITYELPDLEIYINYSLNSVFTGNLRVMNGIIEPIKLLVKKDSFIYYFEMKIRNGYFIISQIDYSKDYISEKLEKGMHK